ncbi:MAG: hypothetical protein C4520_15615 [Candidatus Abyssobacteria bacterium SURF_5]|uniref:DUF4432 family protein n=1 Tax=Abyssobacteria bacterium (strain SURF_5) TaxID=2093360 RepID=A0A3A4NHK5_ABYX5|nr:MAG: hypothetical protein C4520_15615 [Candidatus Abyssubacteria bacterium SURF_5]
MTFEGTRRLLASHGLRTLVLRRKPDEGCLLIAPDLSGRIIAVSLDGPGGENFGFVKEEAIANKGRNPQFNAYGGALRWWIGPEGGQYGLAFPPGTNRFDLDSWRIPEEYNGKSFNVLYPKDTEGSAALLGAECRLENASGTRFHIGVSCRIGLIGSPLPPKKKSASLRHFGYRCEMCFENLSSAPMRRETGLVSIWMLGMYMPSAHAFVIAPFEKGGAKKIVTDTYFSPSGLSRHRLMIRENDGYLVFRADGKERSKIGLSRSRASATLGSIDFTRNLLTVWRFPVRRRMAYVNSLWELQKHPYSGDVVNSYNDDGKIGDFYELECSSPALALLPGERARFPLDIHHFDGPHEALLKTTSRLLGRKLRETDLRT